MAFMLILSHSIVLLCKFTPPHEFSKFSGRKVRIEAKEIEEQRLILGLSPFSPLTLGIACKQSLLSLIRGVVQL